MLQRRDEDLLGTWTGRELSVILTRWEALESSGCIPPAATDAFLRRLEAVTLFRRLDPTSEEYGPQQTAEAPLRRSPTSG